jgi:hypothetical protein
LLYNVSVVFRQDFVRVADDQITIGVMAKPVDGAANIEIIKKLAKHFGVSSANIEIKSGHRSKEKIIEII